MLSPSLSRITNRMRSSITELSFHGIPLPAPFQGKKCNPCLRYVLLPMCRAAQPSCTIEVLRNWVLLDECLAQPKHLRSRTVPAGRKQVHPTKDSRRATDP